MVGIEPRQCSWVHDSLHIDEQGDVFACSYSSPGPVGNIRTHSLREIYNSEAMQEFRRQEMEGRLHCKPNCKFRHHKINGSSLVRDFDSELVRIQIKFGERCNVRCVMCTQDHDSREELDTDLVLSRVEIPPSVKVIYVYGGEPLILRSVRRFFDHCAAYGAKLIFSTNGTAISTTMAAKIALHCEAISFSLNAATKEMHEAINRGSNFERVLANIQRVWEARRAHGTTVSIGGHMTIIEQNLHEIPLFIRRHREFGFQWIDFGFDLSVPLLLAQDPVRKSALQEEIRLALAEAPSEAKIDTMRLKLLGIIESAPPPAAAEQLSA